MVAPTGNDENTPLSPHPIKRQDGPGKPVRWEEFDVPYETGANVISCLQWIAANPRTTVDGRDRRPSSTTRDASRRSAVPAPW